MTLSRRSLLGAALALPALAACGDNAASASGRKTVRLTYGAISVPKTRAVFEKTLNDQGVDVEWIGPFPNHAPTLQAVVTGTADFSFGGSSTPADQALLSGNKLVYVAWSTATPRLSSILVLPDSGITSVKDLAGRNVAVNKAGLGEFLLVTFTYLNPPDAAPAFGSRKVDAWAIWSGPMELAEVQYGAKRLFTDGEELDRQIDFSTYLVREDYARKEADLIRKVIAAYKAEQDWANAHPAEAQRIGNEVSKYSQAVVDKLVAENVQTTWSLMTDEGIAQLQAGADWLSQCTVLSGRIDIADHALLRALAGIDQVDGGTLTTPAASTVVFQEHRLLPWWRVWRNVAIGLPRATARARAQSALARALHRVPSASRGRGDAAFVALHAALLSELGVVEP